MGRSNVPQCWRGEMERGQRESPREECAGERRRRTRGRRRRRRERRRGRREMDPGLMVPEGTRKTLERIQPSGGYF